MQRSNLINKMDLKKFYKEKAVPKLKKEQGIENELSLPRLDKVIVSVGLSEARFDKDATANIIKTLKVITGQKPVARLAKHAISNFKIRIGQPVAYMVTLRNGRMYDFLDKLINITLPRIRDFRGIPSYSIDGNGNINFGIKEQVAFPEIKIEETEKMHGIGITIVTTAKDKKEAELLLKSIGAVILEEKKPKKKAGEKIDEFVVAASKDKNKEK